MSSKVMSFQCNDRVHKDILVFHRYSVWGRCERELQPFLSYFLQHIFTPCSTHLVLQMPLRTVFPAMEMQFALIFAKTSLPLPPSEKRSFSQTPPPS